MFVKRFKRKCDVRGCKNTANVFLISKRREMGNTIAICTECLKEAQSSIDGYVEEKKAIKKEAKPLFPHPELKVTLSSVAEEIKPIEVIVDTTEDTPIEVTDDTVTNEEPIIGTLLPDIVLPKEATKVSSGNKKKTNKKK